VADDIHELARQFEGLSHQLRSLAERVSKLESQGNTGESLQTTDQNIAESEATDGIQEQVNDPLLPFENPVLFLTLIGRTLIVLGGGYLLRMLTDNDILPKLAGVLAGLSYAFIWLFMADREARRLQPLSGFFHGFTACLIAYPLVWETTARFKLIDPDFASFMLVVTTVSALVVAVRAKSAGLTFTASLFSVVTAYSLLLSSSDIPPFAVGLLALVIATEWVARREVAPSVRWVTGLGMNGVLLMMTQLSLRPEGLPEHYQPFSRLSVIVFTLMLISVYLIGTGIRTALKRQSVGSFEVAQTMLALIIGFGVIELLGSRSSALLQGSGIFCVILALASYALAFGLFRPREGLSPTFFYYSSTAALLGLMGSYFLLGARIAAAIWLVVALAELWLGVKFDRITLRYHGTVYLIVGGASTGILTGFSDGMLANARVEWNFSSLGPLVSLVVTAVGYAILLRRGPATRNEVGSEPWFEVLPRFGVTSLLGWALACAAAGWLATAFRVAPSPQADAAMLATIRTAVLAVFAVACASIGRKWTLRELGWLVWPILVLGGAKLLFEDFRHGRPLTLCLALALYGGALVAVSRLLRQRGPIRSGV
jgi:hypothetical protein